MRYEIGDFVSKPVTGVCRIEDILYLDAQGKKDNKLYYRMHPVEDEKETIYVPVSNSDSALRPCLTEENAWKLIEKIPEISTPWTENEKMREQKYKEAIRANDPKALVSDHKDDLPAEATRDSRRERNAQRRIRNISRSRKALCMRNWEQPSGSRSRRLSTRSLSILDKILFDFSENRKYHC
ncbi:MAG: CarD family transcriptional regulator [Pilosibacter sp.]